MADAGDPRGEAAPPTGRLAIRDLAFGYESDSDVLRGITFDVRQGERTGVVGPSGCGKSTLLSLIAGIKTATRGGMESSLHTAPDQHPLTFVFQKDTLLPWLTAAENVGLYYRLKGRRGREVRARVESLLALAGLERAGGLYPYQLSGGMRRRVAFLAAMAPQPALMLLDEPFSALDEPTRLRIHQVVWDILARAETTCVLVTHDIAEALSLCERIVVMGGRPGTVIGEYAVPFGRKRDMAGLRACPEFLSLYGEVWRAVSEEIQKSPGDDVPPDTANAAASEYV